MLRNRIRALLAQHSVLLPENERIYTKQGRAWLNNVKLADSGAHLSRGDCELHDSIEVQIASTDVLINKACRPRSIGEMVAQLAGNRAFLSVLVRWETDDIR